MSQKPKKSQQTDDTQTGDDQSASSAASDETATSGNTTGATSAASSDSSPRANQTASAGGASELAAMKQLAQRAMADLQNFKRRIDQEQKSFIEFATAALLSDVLTVVDNFNRANQTMPAELKENEWVKGVIQIEKQLQSLLQKQGVQEMVTIGQQFDPQKHEAMMQAPGEKNLITAEFEKGYLIGDKVLRPAKVQIGNGE